MKSTHPFEHSETIFSPSLSNRFIELVYNELMSKKKTQKVDIETGDISANNVKIAGRDINIIQPPPPPTASAFFTIESPPIDFTGREKELQQLLTAFDQSDSALLCGLTGSGGIGKTVLARLAAQKLAERFPDARLEINLQGISQTPLDPTEAMRRLLAPFYLAQKLPDDPSALRGLYLATFRQHKVLILLDNAHDAAQVRPLLPEPPSAGIVTSRLGFSVPEKGLRPFKLGLLSRGEARLLLRKVSPRLENEKDGTIDQLANLCSCLPFALRVAASSYESRLDWSLSSFLQRLSDEHTRLSLLSDPDDPDLNVHTCLSFSYDCLSSELQLHFRQLGIFAASFDSPALIAVLGSLPLSINCMERGRGEVAEVDSALGLLLKHHLLDYAPETGQYALHDLTRLFAYERLCEFPDEARLALERYAAYYLEKGSDLNDLYRKGGENLVPAIRMFTSIWPHLYASWRRLSRQDQGCPLFEGADHWLSDFPGRIANLLDLILSPRECIPLLESALKATQRLGDHRLESNRLGNLGISYRKIGDVRKSIIYCEHALAITREIGDRGGEGNHLCNLGNAWADLGEIRKAIEYYEQALVIAREVGDRHSEGIHLGNLGISWSDLSVVRKAIDYHEQALVIAKEFGDYLAESEVLGNLGNAYLTLGEARKAIDFYEQALAIIRETGDRHNEGNTLGNLGLAWFFLCEMRKSFEYYTQALTIHQKICDRRGESNDLGNLGTYYKNLGDVRKAIDYYEEALAIAREIGDHRTEGIHLGDLGIAYRNLGEVCKAIDYNEQSLVIARETGNRRAESGNLSNLGNAWLDLGETCKAIEYYEQSVAIAKEIGDRRTEDHVLGNLGNAWSNKGMVRKAIDYYYQALAIAREIGDRRSEGNHLASLGNAYLNLGEVLKAINFYEQALAIAREIDDLRGEGQILSNLGTAHHNLGDNDRARECFTQALQIFTLIESPYTDWVRQRLEELDQSS
jgi:tetratricopeptide (TPR) repeat protein